MQKLELQQNQLLQQKLSPQQIQIVKMLELPTLELEERINQELIENPALEEGHDFDNDSITNEADGENDDVNDNEESPFDNLNWDDYTDDEPDYKTYAQNFPVDDTTKTFQYSFKNTFSEDLFSQLGEIDLTEKEEQLTKYIIGNIDDDGYLRRDIEQMVDDLAFAGISVTDDEMYAALALVQNLEPAGVAARTLKECLLLQLNRFAENESVTLAKRIVKDYFEEFSNKQYEKIQRRLSINEVQLKDSLLKIQGLNPKPGSAWATSSLNTNEEITPDFIIENLNGRFSVLLNNRNMPELRINSEYTSLIQTYKKSKKESISKDKQAAILFAKEKIDAANWFINAIKQRNETLLSTMNAIVHFQKEFFESGDEALLKPMILKDIANLTGFDISTISRVSNSKYAETEFGVFPLKAFFSETMRKDSGEEISNKEIKRILKESIDAENKRKPLTDDKLEVILREKGYVIARRTIAKYRERLGIPVARLRKTI